MTTTSNAFRKTVEGEVNVPTKTSDLTNDGDDGSNPFISTADVVTGVSNIEALASASDNKYPNAYTIKQYSNRYTNSLIISAIASGATIPPIITAAIIS